MRCLLLCCLPLTAVGSPLLRFEGVATSADGTVAYREVHWQQGSAEGAQRLVQYLCPGGQPFARKEMPATPLPLARGYTLQDRRSGQLAQVRVAGATVGIDWKEDAQARAQLHRIPCAQTRSSTPVSMPPCVRIGRPCCRAHRYGFRFWSRGAGASTR